MRYVSSEADYGIGDEIRRILLVLARNVHVIVLVTIVTVVLMILYIWFATVLYSSRVDILLDPRQRETVESQVTPTGLGTSAAGADTLLLESQVEIIRSQKIIDVLVASEKLTSDPEFVGTATDGPINWAIDVVKSVVYGPQEELMRPSSPYDQAVKKLRKRLNVSREANTYVISITMKSGDSEKAARLANRVAEIYIADVNEAAADSTREAASVLSAKLGEMRAAVNEAAAAVEDYKQKNNLVNLIDANKSLVVEQQLSDLNHELSKARSELQVAHAHRNQLRDVVSVNADPGLRLPEFADSPVVSLLQTHLAEEQSALAEQAAVYGDNHPVMKRSRDRIVALKVQLNEALQRVLERLELAYNTALERTDSLETEVAELEKRVGVSNTNSIQLRELEREAESIKAVYEVFLRRSMEAQEQIDIPHSTARIISRAYPASQPSDPAVFVLLASGVGFGTSLGIVTVLLFGGLPRPPVFQPEGYMEDPRPYYVIAGLPAEQQPQRQQIADHRAAAE